MKHLKSSWLGVLGISLLVAGCGAQPSAKPVHHTKPPTAAKHKTSPSPPKAPAPSFAQYTSVSVNGSGQALVAGDLCQGSPQTCVGRVLTLSGSSVKMLAQLGNVFPQQMQFSGNTGWMTAITPATCYAQCTTEVLSTGDGGSTWHLLAAIPTTLPHGLDFTSASDGFLLAANLQGPKVVGQPISSLLRTTDGGKTWAPVDLGGYSPTSISFPDVNNGWLTGMDCTTTGLCKASLFASSEGGTHWTATRNLGTVGLPNVSFVDFSTVSTGWLMQPVGGSGCNPDGCFGALYTTQDGGKTWTALQPSGIWPDQKSWYSAQQTTGWPLGLYFTGADGWIPVSAGAANGVGGVEFSKDKGATWTRLGVQDRWDLRAFALDPATGDAYALMYLLPTQAGQGPSGPVMAEVSPGGASTIIRLPQ